MIDTEKIIEFDKVKEQLMELAYTTWAKEQMKKLKPYLAQTQVMKALMETTEARLLIEKCGNPPMTALENVQQYLLEAEKGGCLTAWQLEQIAGMLTGVRRLKDYLSRAKDYEIALAYYEENLDSMEQLRGDIELKIRAGQVDDYATRTLKKLREDMEKTRQKMQEKADSILRSRKECMSDSFSTTRNGHICLPVKKEYRLQVGGTVIDKSSTGNTLFIEPASVSKYQQELQLLEIEEENEVRTILYTLTVQFAEGKDLIEKNNRTIEKLDFAFAKGKLSLKLEAVEPEIHAGRYMRLTAARHPLMDVRKHVPLDFELGESVQGIVITGPNTGGKTVAIKTVALAAMMAQCGLHVPCRAAEICLNSQILCDIGDGQNIAENLSTFSAHITNVLQILKKADANSLVIMDELGSGTDPTEGMGIAVAVLQELKKSGTLYLVTTHYPEIKRYARETEGVVNARMTFDKESLRPLYQLVIGEAGESCAFAIAKRLGMPGSMLKNAKIAAYGRAVSSRAEEAGAPIGLSEIDDKEELIHEKAPSLRYRKESANQILAEKFHLGDSVMVYPERKIGIVCQPVDEKGILRVQIKNKKIYINHKRVKLHVPADQLYPPDYDFAILFDSVKERKIRHDMQRKYVEGVELEISDDEKKG